MKPQNKYQENIFKLSSKLNPLSKIHEKWAMSLFKEKFAYNTKNETTCFECGHKWNEKGIINAGVYNVKCPSCKTTLSTNQKKFRKYHDFFYFDITKNVKGIQVVRRFMVDRYLAVGYKVEYFFNEIAQHWLDTNGRQTIIARNKQVYWFSKKCPWVTNKPMSFKKDKKGEYYDYTAVLYPKVDIIPEIHRNGFKANINGFDNVYLLQNILYDNKFETLLKTERYDIIEEFTNDGYIQKYWKQICLCIRYKYMFNDKGSFKMWCDHLDLLVWFNKDIHNPKFICPENLHKEHQRLIKLKKEIEHKLHFEEIKANIKKDNVGYRKRLGKLRTLSFSKDRLSIHVLRSVKEFYDEGEYMEHCLFTNEYHKKESSLILTSSLDKTKLETIEVSLKNFKVVQSYGLNNKTTEFHDEIITLVNNNMKLIKKTYNANRKTNSYHLQMVE